MRPEPAQRTDLPVPRPAVPGGAVDVHRVQSLSVRLAVAGTAAEVLEAVAAGGAELLGAELVNISLLDRSGSRLRLVRAAGTPLAVEAEFADYPVDAPLPSRDALASGRPVLLRSRAERDRRYPALAGVRVEQQALCVLPLMTARRTIGVLGLGWRERTPSSTEVEAAEAVGQLVAGALERALAFEAETAARRSAEQAEIRLRVLQHLSEQLAAATDRDRIGRIIVDSAFAALGADAATVSAADPDGLSYTVIAVRGLGPPIEQPGQRFRLDAVALGRELLATHRPVIVRSRSERDARFPDMRATEVEQQAWVNVLLEIDARPVGVASFGWKAPRDVPAEDAAMLAALGRHCAAALDRVRLFEAEHDARDAAEAAQRRLTLLARVSRSLAEARSEDQLFSDLLAVLLEDLAVLATVLLPDETGRLVRRRVLAADPTIRDLAGPLLSQPVAPADPPAPDSDPRLVAWTTGQPAGCPDVTAIADTLTQHDPALTSRLTDLQIGPMLAVPLAAGGQRLGVLILFRRQTGPVFSDDDVDLLAEVGQRTGGAMNFLRLLDVQTRVAAALQRSLLPDHLPQLAGAELAARYLPADAAAEVGGDFYDAFALGDGSHALIIGDVAGRGIDAAGITGLARAHLRGLDANIGPAQALQRLNRVLLTRTGFERFLTAAYLRMWLPDAAGQPAQLTVAVAGHPLPLLLHPTGDVEPVGVPGTLLGLLDAAEISEQHVEVPAGAAVVLYTDGVLEAHGPAGLFGEDRLTAALTGVAGRSADAVADAVIDAVQDYRTGGPDDTAVLVLRRLPDAPDAGGLLLDLHLPAHTRVTGIARRDLRHATTGLLALERQDDLLLAATELISNAIRHCHPLGDESDGPTPIRVRLRQRPDRLTLDVHNPGSGFTLPSDPTLPMAAATPLLEQGRGLALARHLATAAGTDFDGISTRVWLDFATS